MSSIAFGLVLKSFFIYYGQFFTNTIKRKKFEIDFLEFKIRIWINYMRKH